MKFEPPQQSVPRQLNSARSKNLQFIDVPSRAAGRERNGGVLVLNIFLGWTLVGWVVALAWAASLPHKPKPSVVSSASQLTAAATPDIVRCPFCAEDIKPEAVVCKHCGRELNTATTERT